MLECRTDASGVEANPEPGERLEGRRPARYLNAWEKELVDIPNLDGDEIKIAKLYEGRRYA